jgi:hypothetical protein
LINLMDTHTNEHQMISTRTPLTLRSEDITNAEVLRDGGRIDEPRQR